MGSASGWRPSSEASAEPTVEGNDLIKPAIPSGR